MDKRKNVLFYITTITALQAGFIAAYPKGGPVTLCYDPYPHHAGSSRSLDPSPFSISLSATEYNPGDTIKVTISSSTTDMKGFQIAAHSTFGKWDQLFGEFLTYPQDAQTYSYYSGLQNCATHNEDFVTSRNVELEWKAPSLSVGDLIFSASVIKDYATFWVNQTALLKAKLPAQPNVVIPPLQISAGEFMPRLNLDKCGTESGCITYPADCTAETCIFTISYAATVNGIRFRLLNKQAQSQHSYVGMGISSDQKMPADETFICMDVGGSLDFAHGYNPDMYNVKVVADEVSDIAIQSVDGAISCEFTRKLKGNFTYYGHKGLAMLNVDYTASLESEDYHLYLVWGHPYEGSKESVHKHQLLPIVSQSKVAFNKKTRTKFYRLHNSVKVHVTFMVLAWFGAVSVAMVISRYFKNGFLNAKDTICGTKPWFQIHRGLAFLAALLTAIAFVVIFVRIMGLSSQKELLHAGFGIAVMILTVVQVIMGLARPDGDAGRKRVAFNWMHMLTGSASYILAAVTMLLGSNFSYMSEKMKSDGTGLLIALISVHVFTAFVFEIRKRCADSSKDAAEEDDKGIRSIESLDIEEPSEQAEGKTAPHTKSMALFTIYVILIFTLVASFLYIVWKDL